jgi:hypothetical protein
MNDRKAFQGFVSPRQIGTYTETGRLCARNNRHDHDITQVSQMHDNNFRCNAMEETAIEVIMHGMGNFPWYENDPERRGERAEDQGSRGNKKKKKKAM